MKDNDIVRVCEVISVKDDDGMDRIKVRMSPEDNARTNKELIEDNNNYVFPLLPKIFFVKPKVGECVLVIAAISNNGDTQRYYMGPVLSQQNKINFDPFETDARSIFRGSQYAPMKSPYYDNGDSKGSFPDDEDVYITGRRNADIQIKEEDIRLRCGVKKATWTNKQKFKFNNTDPAYILLRYYDLGLNNSTKKEDKCNSVANIVADKINLIGTNSKHHYRVTDTDKLITDEEMKKIIETAHQLPYGDKLVEFLDIFRKAFLNHTHSHYLLPPIQDPSTIPQLEGFELKTMLSDTVRIN